MAGEFLAAEAGSPGSPAAGEADDGAAAGRELSWYGDSAYGTGDLRGAIDDAGHQAVIKPKPLQAPVKGGFTVDDFTVDEEAGTVTCPAGHAVALSRTRVATFGVLCRTCRCVSGARPARPAASSSCTPAMTCSARPAPAGPPAADCARTTGHTARTSSASSPQVAHLAGTAAQAPLPRDGQE